MLILNEQVSRDSAQFCGILDNYIYLMEVGQVQDQSKLIDAIAKLLLEAPRGLLEMIYYMLLRSK